MTVSVQLTYGEKIKDVKGGEFVGRLGRTQGVRGAVHYCVCEHDCLLTSGRALIELSLYMRLQRQQISADNIN